MKNLINFDDVNNRIITIRNQNVLLDAAVAEIYGVETRDINKAVKNNPDKFLEGYIFELTPTEKRGIVENLITSSEMKVVETFHHHDSTHSMAYLEKIKLSPALPKAFTEKGLYMLATILKSPRATRATITIVETFAKLRELQNNIVAINSIESEVIDPEIIESTGGLLNEMLFSGIPTSAKTSLELNLGLMKLKREITSESPNVARNIQTIENKIDELKKMLAQMNENKNNS